MRLVRTLSDPKKAQAISALLKRQGIDNVCEIQSNTDWGSPDYGTTKAVLWVVMEEQFDEAVRIVDEMEHKSDIPTPPALPEVPLLATSKDNPLRQIRIAKPKVQEKRPLGVITFYFLALCCILLLISEMTAPPIVNPPPGIPYTPLFTAPIKKELMFDYPETFVLIDHIVKAYGIESLQDPATLPREGQILFAQFQQTPYWHGLYQVLIDYFRNPAAALQMDAPLFEKIREGEFWRLFTPSVLHSDIFHLFFNMIWLVVIGRQMEERMGKKSYLLFILATGIISNTLQYLAGGPNFLGFSGVLCAMLTYVWVRQKKAAWEGYQLLPSTMGFISIFIGAMFTLQLISFTMESLGYDPLSPGIANTAHLSGAALGWIIGYLKK